jgi:hypothetical protein
MSCAAARDTVTRCGFAARSTGRHTLASNKTEEGRAKNRRVQLVEGKEASPVAGEELTMMPLELSAFRRDTRGQNV